MRKLDWRRWSGRGRSRDVASSLLVATSVGFGLWVLQASVPTSVLAQRTPHPREMGLMAPASPRPNPTDYSVTLANGLVGYLVPDHTAPLVTLTAFVGAGFVDGKEGAAEAWVQALRSRGPDTFGAAEFQRALRDMVAEYDVSLGPEIIEIRLDVPAEDAPAAAEMLVAMLTRGPAIDPGLIESAANAGNLSDDTSGASGPVSYEGSLDGAVVLFRNHVLGATAYGHTPSLDDWTALTPDDIQGFRDEFLTSGNVVVSVGGDFDVEWAKQALAGLNALDRGGRHERRTRSSPAPEVGRSVMTYLASKLQGWVVMGHELPVVPSSDEAALEVMNYILGGGHFDTRLFRATRDQRGLTNDDSSFLEPNRDGPGTYTLRTYGRPEVVRLLIDLTLKEVVRIRDELVSEEELFVAKGALADGVFAARYKSGWATARSLAEERVIHGDHGRSEDYQARIRSVTAEEVRSAARTYLHPDRMDIVIVGPIDDIVGAPALEGEGALRDYGRVFSVGR